MVFYERHSTIYGYGNFVSAPQVKANKRQALNFTKSCFSFQKLSSSIVSTWESGNISCTACPPAAWPIVHHSFSLFPTLFYKHHIWFAILQCTIKWLIYSPTLVHDTPTFIVSFFLNLPAVRIPPLITIQVNKQTLGIFCRKQSYFVGLLLFLVYLSFNKIDLPCQRKNKEPIILNLQKNIEHDGTVFFLRNQTQNLTTKAK